MKVVEILSEDQDYSKFNLHQLTDVVLKAIKNDSQSSFDPKDETKMNNSEFDGADTAIITVSYVDSRSGGEESHQNTSKKLNKIVDPLYRAFRAQGLIFTQPKGLGKANEDDRLRTGELQFVIGKKKD